MLLGLDRNWKDLDYARKLSEKNLDAVVLYIIDLNIKENVEKFAKWTGIEVTIKGSGSKVTKQSVDTGKDIDKVKKIKITLGD